MSNQPRSVTLEQIEAEIASEHYFTAADGICGCAERAAGYVPNEASSAHDTPLSLLTFCVLVLRNGFTVTGQSACADPAKFNADMGRKLAREDAIRQCWKLLGFRLRDQIAAEQGSAPAAKRYAREDLDLSSLKWATYPHASDPLGEKANYFVRLRDGREIRGAIQMPYDTPTPTPSSRIATLCAMDALRVANGEQP